MSSSPDISKAPRFSLSGWSFVPSTGSHFDALDGLRGVAILIVVAFHAVYVNPAHGLLARGVGYFSLGGWMGVPIFFVLSGFLISYPFFKGRTADPQFWCPVGYARRRLGKIIPPFYLSLILFLGFYWAVYADPAYLQSAWKWALGLGNFIPISPNFNGVYWSLIVEAHFYLVLPIIFWLTRGRSVRQTSIIAFLLLFMVPLIMRQIVWPADIYTLPNWDTPLHQELWLKLHRFPCALDYFAWGVAFAGIFTELWPHRVHLRPLSVFGYCGALLLLVTITFWGFWSEFFQIRGQPTQWSMEVGHLLPSAATLLVLFFLFDPKCWGSRILSWPWLRLVGIVSYEWFLFHGPIVHWFHENFAPSKGSILAYLWRTAAPVLLTFVFSVAVYRFFSLPILNWVRGRLPDSSGSRLHSN